MELRSWPRGELKNQGPSLHHITSAEPPIRVPAVWCCSLQATWELRHVALIFCSSQFPSMNLCQQDACAVLRDGIQFPPVFCFKTVWCHSLCACPRRGCAELSYALRPIDAAQHVLPPRPTTACTEEEQGQDAGPSTQGARIRGSASCATFGLRV